MKLAGIVTLYYPEKEVKENIKSYLDSLEVLYVIDNTPGKQNQHILPESSKIQYIFNNKNIGVASALNKGAELAIENGYHWLLTMDQDSQFQKNSIDKMIQYIKENKQEQIGLISPWHKTNADTKKPKDTIDYPIEVMTSGNIINLDIYQKIGGYKDWLFIDCIDFDYCMNIHKHGYQVIRLNEIEMEHDLGDIKVKHILGRNFVCSNHNYIRRYYIVRNIYYIYDLYHDLFPDYCNFIKHGLRGTWINILLFEKNKYKKLKAMYQGYQDYKKGIKGEWNPSR